MKDMHEINQHPILNITLWVLSGIMYFISAETIDLTYVWGFRILSVISLCLIIGVNWEKGLNGLKKMFGLDKDKSKKKNKK